MTIFTVKGDVLDMRNVDIGNLRDYLNTYLTPTEARYSNDDSNYLSIIGTGLTYISPSSGMFSGGTVTEIHSINSGIEHISVTGLNLDAWTLEGAIRSDDAEGLFDSILAGNDVIKGSNTTADGDYILGKGGNDTIFGRGGADYLKGEHGSDRLVGGKQQDRLYGGWGNDSLDGGAGHDALTGGDGRDSFVFTEVPYLAHADQIMDFNPADDSILLARSAFGEAGPAGALAPWRFHAGTAAHDANDRIIYDAAAQAIYYDDDGTGAHAQRLIAYAPAPASPLTAADFSII